MVVRYVCMLLHTIIIIYRIIMICIVFNLYDHIVVIEYSMYRFIIIRPVIKKKNFNGFENRYMNVCTHIAFGVYTSEFYAIVFIIIIEKNNYTSWPYNTIYTMQNDNIISVRANNKYRPVVVGIYEYIININCHLSNACDNINDTRKQ